MPPKRHIPRDELEELVKKGYKLKHMAEHFGCDISVVKRALEEYGIPFEVKFAEKKHVPKDYLVKKIKEGYSLRKIARELGVSYATVLNRVKEYGLDPKELRIPRERLKELVKKGYTQAELAAYFGVHRSTIRRRMRECGLRLKRRRRYWERYGARISKSLLQKWYVEEGLSAGKIARELGVAESTVHYYLKKYGLRREKKPPRTPTREEIVHLYWEKGLSINKTARTLKIGVNKLYELMEKYGIERRAEKSVKKYSDEDILRILREVYEKYGRIPTQKEFREDEEIKLNVKTVLRRFGSWEGAFEKALNLTKPRHPS